jgi:di/tricarboxylate transporter
MSIAQESSAAGEWVARLLADPLLAQAAYGDLARLVSYLEERQLLPGETLYQVGDAANNLYLLMAGDLLLTPPGESPRGVGHRRAGEEAATGCGAYLASVASPGGARVLVVPRGPLNNLLAASPLLRDGLWQSLTRTLAGGELAGEVSGSTGSTGSAASPSPSPVAASDLKKVIGWLCTLLAPAVVLIMAPHWQLAPHAGHFLAIFAATVTMWIFNLVDEYIPGVFAMVATLAMGLVPIPVMLSGLASDGFLLAMSVLGLATVIVASGLSYRLILLILLKLPNTPFWHNTSLLLVGFLLTPMVPSINGRVALLVPFYRDMLEILRLKPKSLAANGLAITTFTAAGLLSAVFLSSKSVNFVVFGLLSDQAQDQFQWLEWLIAAAGTGFALIATFALLAGWVFRGLPQVELSKPKVAAQLSLLGELKAREWAAVFGVVIFMLGVASSSLHAIKPAWLGLAVLYALLLFGSLSKKEFREKIDWPFLLYLAGIVGLTAALNHLGLTQKLAGQLPELGAIMQHNFALFIALLAGLIFIIRLAVPISATIVVLVTVLMPIADSHGVNPWIVGFIVLVLGEMWFFPYQCSYYLQFQKLTGHSSLYDEPGFLRFNWIMNGLKLLAIYVSIPWWKALGLL